MTANYEDDEDIKDLPLSTQMALSMLEEMAKPWVPPPKTEMELKLERFAQQIQDITLDTENRGHDETIEAQMRALDLMFRSLVTEGSKINRHSDYAMALRTQTAYRRTWAALNFFRTRGNNNPALPPIDNKTS